MVTWQFFFPQAHAFTSVTSASCQLFDTCCDPPVPFSLYSCPFRMDGLLVIKSTTVCGSWISSQPLKEFEQQQVKSSAVIFFLFRGLTTFLRVLHCFVVFWIISDMVFKAGILSTYDFFEQRVSCTSPTLSVSVAAATAIRYRIQALEAISTVEHNEPGL